jgi:hypothetical protein
LKVLLSNETTINYKFLGCASQHIVVLLYVLFLILIICTITTLIANEIIWSKSTIGGMFYHDPNLGLATKARAYKVTGQEGSPIIMPHAPRSVRKCEGIDPYTPKGTPTLGVGISVDSQMFRGWLQGSKPNGLKSYLYNWKSIKT